MHAHFSEWGTPVPHGKLPPFRFWCQKTLPTLYDDSLSYYEVLSNVTWYINQIINVCKVYDDKFCELMGVYKQLEHYVNCYFDNLNVPQTIADILDDMAYNGRLTQILLDFMPDYAIEAKKIKGGIVVIHYNYDTTVDGVEKYNRVEKDKEVVDALRYGSVIMGAFNGSPTHGNFFAMMDSATYTYEEVEKQCAGGCPCKYMSYDCDFTVLFDEVTTIDSETWTLDGETATFIKRRICNDTKGEKTTVEYTPLCAEIADGYVTHFKMANDAIWSENIKDGEVKTPDLADGAVTTVKLADNSVTSAKIVDGTVQTADLADGSVTTDKLADNSVTSAKIVDGSVGTVDLADNGVTTPKLADNSVTSAKIVDGTIQTVDLADGSVTEPKLADNAVTSAKIKDGEVKTVDLGDGAVTTAKLADDAVTSAKIKDGEVKTNDLADGSVTTNKLANDSVTSAKIADGGVATADLANGAVTTIKIADNAVTSAKIVDRNVTPSKIALRRFIFIGDSYGAGTGISGGSTKNWIDFCATRLGLSSDRYKKSAVDGSGFTTNNSQTTFLVQLQTIANSMTADDKLLVTDIVVAGGWNDGASSIDSAAASFDSYVEANFPNAIVHLGYMAWENSSITSGNKLSRIAGAMNYAETAGKNGWAYMGNLEYIMHDYTLFVADGVHPNEEGQRQLANAVATHLMGGTIHAIKTFREITNVVFDSNVTPANPSKIVSTWRDNNMVGMFTSYTDFEFTNPVTFSGHPASNHTHDPAGSVGWQKLFELGDDSFVQDSGFHGLNDCVNVTLYNGSYYKDYPCWLQIRGNALYMCPISANGQQQANPYNPIENITEAIFQVGSLTLQGWHGYA